MKIPPIETSRISCLRITATTPMAPPKRERAHIAHEHFRGMRVVPEKAQRCAGERAAKNGKFGGIRNFLDVQVFGKARIARKISQHRQRDRGNQHAADRQTIQPIGEIHSVRKTGDHEHQEQNERNESERPDKPMGKQRLDHQIRMQPLDETARSAGSNTRPSAAIPARLRRLQCRSEPATRNFLRAVRP